MGTGVARQILAKKDWPRDGSYRDGLYHTQGHGFWYHEVRVDEEIILVSADAARPPTKTQASIGQPFGQLPIGMHRQLAGTRTGRGGPFPVYQQSTVLIGIGCWDGQGTVALALLAVNLSTDDKRVRYRLICRLESVAEANVRALECGLVGFPPRSSLFETIAAKRAVSPAVGNRRR